MPLGAVHLRYELGPPDGAREALPHPLFDLLGAVNRHGSVKQAALALGLSYRHVWGALRDWEQAIGEPLVRWSRGQPARLTPRGQALMWAEARARARLAPQVDLIRLGLSQALAAGSRNVGPVASAPVWRLQAAYDPLWAPLAAGLQALGLACSIEFVGAAAALEALTQGRCDAVLGALPAGLPEGWPRTVLAGRTLGWAHRQGAALAGAWRWLLANDASGPPVDPPGAVRLPGGEPTTDALAAAVAAGDADGVWTTPDAAARFGLAFDAVTFETLHWISPTEPPAALAALMAQPAWAARRRAALTPLPG